jgi:hypothetical protein
MTAKQNSAAHGGKNIVVKRLNLEALQGHGRFDGTPVDSEPCMAKGACPLHDMRG